MKEKMDTANVEAAEIDVASLVDRIEDAQHLASQLGGADLAIDLAFLYPDAVFLREQGGEGTSLMERAKDGAWYFVD